MCEPSIIEHKDGQLEEIHLFGDSGMIVNSEYDRLHNLSRYRDCGTGQLDSWDNLCRPASPRVSGLSQLLDDMHGDRHNIILYFVV